MPQEATEHSFDFPELVTPPYANYIETMVGRGSSRADAMDRLIVMDVLVYDAFRKLGTSLAFMAPELRPYSDETAETKEVIVSCGFTEEEAAACVNKALSVLGGAVLPSEVWPEAA